MSARRAQGRAASSERSEQRCFEIMNMNDKHSYSLLMRPANFSAEKFFSRIFSGKNFSPEFSAEKIFQNFFSKIFFSRIFSGKNFSKIFLNFFSPDFFRITQRNPRIEFIGISFPFNQGFLFLLVAANNFFNSKNILICFLQFCFVK